MQSQLAAQAHVSAFLAQLACRLVAVGEFIPHGGDVVVLAGSKQASRASRSESARYAAPPAHCRI